MRRVAEVADQVIENEFSVPASGVLASTGPAGPRFDAGNVLLLEVSVVVACIAPPHHHASDPHSPAFKSENSVTLSDNDKVVRFTGSGKSYIYGTVGVSSGRATWEFRCDVDTNTDECLCYGCGTKPVTDPNYESSSSMFTIRGYSGRIYHGGTASRTVEKIHPNDRVRPGVGGAAWQSVFRVQPALRRFRPGALHTRLRNGRGVVRDQRRRPGRRLHGPPG